MQPLLCPSYHSLCRILDPLTGKRLSALLFSLDLQRTFGLHSAGDPNLLQKVFAMWTGEGKNTITLFQAIHFTWELEPFCGAQKSSM